MGGVVASETLVKLDGHPTEGECQTDWKGANGHGDGD